MKKALCFLLVLLILLPAAGALAATRQEILARAEGALRTPYEWGKAGPEAYDAAGLVSYVLTGIHWHVGTVATFYNKLEVSAEPKPGDLCVNQNTCGIYMGGGQMIGAFEPGGSVRYSPLERGMIIGTLAEFYDDDPVPTPPPPPPPPPSGDAFPALPLSLLAAAALCGALLLLRRRRA